MDGGGAARSYTPELDAFGGLTRRPFLVVDTETTLAEGSKIQRLVSYAIVPVIDGKVRRDERITGLVHPGVPIHEKSTDIHGITDAHVEGLPEFDAHILDVLAAFDRPGAILVAHNAPFDVTVLRNEFALLGATFPDLPVIDTMRLPAATGFTSTSLTTTPKLTLLAAALGVKLARHHNADADALAAADILIQLLNRAAVSGTGTDIDTLLVDTGRLRTSTIKDAGHTRSRDRGQAWTMPAEHVAEHEWTLPSPRQFPRGADGVALWERWWAHVTLCAELRCPVLDDDLATIAGHRTDMASTPLLANARTLTEPGQHATLVGATMRVITPAMLPRQELNWWKALAPLIATAPRCTSADACPACRKGDPCPLDVAHEYAADALLCEPTGELCDFDRKLLPSLPDYRVSAPKVAGRLAWRMAEVWLADRDPVKAGQVLAAAEAEGLHRFDPDLATRVATLLVGRGLTDQAIEVLTEVHAPGSTNPAQVGVAAALARLDAKKAADAAEPAASKHAHTPAKRRPAGRTRPNPFRPWA